MKKDKDKKGVPVTVINLGTGKKTVSYYNPNTPPETPEYIKNIRNLKNNLLVKSIETTKESLKFNAVSEALKPLTEWQRRIKSNFEYWQNFNDNIKRLANIELIEWIKKTEEKAEDVRQETKKLKENQTLISSGKAREIIVNKEALKVSNSVLGIVCFYAGFQRTEQIKGFFLDIGITPTDNRIREAQRNRNKEHRNRKNKAIRGDLNKYFCSLEISLKLMRALKLTGKMRLRDRMKRVGEIAGFK